MRVGIDREKSDKMNNSEGWGGGGGVGMVEGSASGWALLLGQGGEGLPGQGREDQTRRRTGRMGEGLDDGTEGCTYRSPSEARAEELFALG